MAEWQIKGENAALPQDAFDPDFAAEQRCQLAADGQAETRAPVLPAGGAVRLLECFENDLLLVRGDADAGVGHDKRHDLPCSIKMPVAWHPARFRRCNPQRYLASLGELDGVGQQVFQYLLQTLGIGL